MRSIHKFLVPSHFLLVSLLGTRSHGFRFFRVKMSVDQHLLFLIFGVIPNMAQFSALLDPFFQFLHLHKIVISDFQPFLFAVDKLKTFIEPPLVLFHEIGHHNSTSSRFSMHRMNQTRLPLFHSFLDKSKNSIHSVVLLVENLR